MQLRKALVTVQPTIESALQTHQTSNKDFKVCQQKGVMRVARTCLHKTNCRGVTEVSVKIPCDVEEKRFLKRHLC